MHEVGSLANVLFKSGTHKQDAISGSRTQLRTLQGYTLIAHNTRPYTTGGEPPSRAAAANIFYTLHRSHRARVCVIIDPLTPSQGAAPPRARVRAGVALEPLTNAPANATAPDQQYQPPS